MVFCTGVDGLQIMPILLPPDFWHHLKLRYLTAIAFIPHYYRENFDFTDSPEKLFPWKRVIL